MNLFQINSAIENFEFKVDEETGEVLNLDELDNLEMQKNEKIENIALFIKNLKANEQALDNEYKAMYSRKKATVRKRQYLEQYLAKTLLGTKFETPKCKVSFRKSTQVCIEDEEKFISKYRDTNLVKETVTTKPVKKEILNALKNDALSVEYASLKEEKNIQIK